MLSYQKTLDALSQIKNDKGAELKFSDMEWLIDDILKSKLEQNPDNTEVIENLKKVKSDMQNIRSDFCEGLDGKCDTFDLLPLSQKDLGDVLKVLDGATNSILDQTDHINTLLTKDSLDKVAISEAVMKICESCNFQDLTGQRLTRIMQNLARFENSVSAILNAIIGKDIKNRADKKLEYANDSLMNGPEFLEEAPKQKNIDDIFGS